MIRDGHWQTEKRDSGVEQDLSLRPVRCAFHELLRQTGLRERGWPQWSANTPRHPRASQSAFPNYRVYYRATAFLGD